MIKVINAHSRLFRPEPITRELCMPVYANSQCCRSSGYNINTIRNVWQRGEIIDVEYPRNNHIGGFVRWSIVEYGNDRVLESKENVFQYNCAMTTCNGINGNPYGSDPNWEIDNGNMCRATIKIPEYLKDGYYTIQYRIHSQGDSYNIRNLGLMDFVSCFDLEIRGGELKEKDTCPAFVYGDVIDNNKVSCEFFKDNKINTCTNDRTCFGWFARAPPQDIIECSTNIIDGGLQSSLQKNYRNIQSEELNIEQSSNPRQNPNPSLNVDLSMFRRTNISTTTSMTTSMTTQTTTILKPTPIKPKEMIIKVGKERFKCVKI
jgi:hypothetical protein